MNNVIEVNFNGSDFTVRPLKSVHVEYTTNKKQPRFFDMLFQQEVRRVIDSLLVDHCEQDALMVMAGCCEVERDINTAEYREKIIKALENNHD